MSATLSALPLKLFFSYFMHGIHVLFQAWIFLVVYMQLVKNLHSLSITEQIHIGSWQFPQTAWNHTHKVLRHASLLFVKLPNYLPKNNGLTIESSLIHGNPIPALIKLAILPLPGVLSNLMPQKDVLIIVSTCSQDHGASLQFWEVCHMSLHIAPCCCRRKRSMLLTYCCTQWSSFHLNQLMVPVLLMAN